MRNLQKQVKKAFCYQKMFWPFTVRINCSSDLKVGQNNFDNKILFLSLLLFQAQTILRKKKDMENPWENVTTETSLDWQEVTKNISQLNCSVIENNATQFLDGCPNVPQGKIF